MPVELDEIREVVIRTLEETAFVFAEPAPEAELEGGVATVIRFDGPASGRMVLASTAPFCVELAATLLGSEPDDPEAEANAGAALAELLNILAGALVHRMFGRTAVCDLGIPAPVAADEAAAAQAVVALVTDGGERLELRLELEEARA